LLEQINIDMSKTKINKSRIQDQNWKDRKVTYPTKQDLILPDFKDL
jgi:hypothetical protein